MIDTNFFEDVIQGLHARGIQTAGVRYLLTDYQKKVKEAEETLINCFQNALHMKIRDVYMRDIPSSQKEQNDVDWIEDALTYFKRGEG